VVVEAELKEEVEEGEAEAEAEPGAKEDRPQASYMPK
jgi:hypothetical protein